MKKIIFLLLALAAMQASAQTAEQLLQKAQSSYDAKQYAAALEWQEKFLALQPGSDGGNYNAACFSALSGYKQKAITYLQKSLDLGYGSKYLEDDSDLVSLHKEPQWPSLAKQAQDNYNAFEARMLQKAKALQAQFTAAQAKLEQQYLLSIRNIDTSGNWRSLYQRLKTFNGYPSPHIQGRFLCLYFALSDTARMPFSVRLPDQYDANKKYPLLVVLHGGVRGSVDLPLFADTTMAGYFNRHFTKYADLHRMIVVYPQASRTYNWMYPDSGFAAVPGMVDYLKHLLNVDDSRVYVTGHSNGATGSFAYLLKDPSLFATFSGMNTSPKMRGGGTFLPNMQQQLFYNIATTNDYYFPPTANDSLQQLCRRLQLHYRVAMNAGFPHWFPQYDEADAPVKAMMDTLALQQRNPFAPTVYWECDAVEHGTCNWLSITALDTTATPRSWQQQYNFTINQWVSVEDPSKTVDSTAWAFSYPRRSGAVKASYAANVFRIETSRVKSVVVKISPEMVKMDAPVNIYVNGRLAYHAQVAGSKAFLLRNFQQHFDRQALWVNEISLPVE